MIDAPQALRSYLAPPRDAFWKWDKDLDAVLWSDGRTIAFITELAEILDGEAPYGLPSLSAVVLLLAACRDSWGSAPTPVHILLGQIRWINEHLTTRDSQAEYDSDWVNTLLEDLHQISELPRELRGSTRAKSALIAAVFEDEQQRTSRETAGTVVDVLQQEEIPPLCVESITRHDLGWQVANIESIRRLAERLAKFDLNAFRLRMETGLDIEILPAEIEEPFARRVRQLLDDLKDDEELAGLARLTRSLMAVTNLPRPLDVNEDLPIGGVSDISNRGSFDRLLLSELAADNDVLTMRVAMNEALYLRRETSTQTPPRHRVVVVDSGLRLWGVPRVYATSVAMSLAALTETGVEFTAFRPEGNLLETVDFSTRDGILDHLHALPPDAHPGAALSCLQRDLAECEHEYDAILVTAADVLADPEFQRALDNDGEAIRFIAAVTRDGGFRLLERTPRGVKVLREASLDLDRLLAPSEKPTQPLIDANGPSQLPAIMRVSPFPLRMPHHMNWKQAWTDGQGRLFAVTNDHRLMLWDVPDKAARQIIERLPSRNVLWSDGNDQSARFVVGNPGKFEAWLIIAETDGEDVQIIELAGSMEVISGVSAHGGVLFAIRRTDIDIYDASSGQRIKTIAIPTGFTWVNDRFFQGPTSWTALSYDGVRPRFEEVVNYSHYADLWRLTTMIDVEGIEGPVGLSELDGRLYHTATRKEVPLQKRLPGTVRLLAKSHCGKRLVVEYDSPTPAIREKSEIHPLNGQVRSTWQDPFETVLNVGPFANPTLYKRFQAIYPLMLRGRNLRLWALALDLTNDFMHLSARDPNSVPAHADGWRKFEQMSVSRNIRFGLQSATWPDGSQAVLDSRGLLHLKSSDENLPECSIVLCHNALAGWCSDGRRWGPAMYHMDDGHLVSAREIWEEVLTPFARICDSRPQVESPREGASGTSG